MKRVCSLIIGTAIGFWAFSSAAQMPDDRQGKDPQAAPEAEGADPSESKSDNAEVTDTSNASLEEQVATLQQTVEAMRKEIHEQLDAKDKAHQKEIEALKAIRKPQP